MTPLSGSPALLRLSVSVSLNKGLVGFLRAPTWGGVLLIPRSADEWKEGQTHMHVRLASIHPLASSGGEVNTQPTRRLPPGQRHALPSG